jgi:AcrR family transcriptional regulator
MARTLTETKKAAILRAAQRAFAVRDFHEVLTDDIAAEAGIGKGTIYRYFETKEDLYFATLVCGFEELHEVLRAALPHEKSPSRRLERIAEEILRIFWNRRSFYTLLHSDQRRFHAQDRLMRQHRDRVIDVVEETLLEGVAKEELRPLDVRMGAELFMGMVRSALFYRRPTAQPAELVRQVLELFLHGMTLRETA